MYVSWDVWKTAANTCMQCTFEDCRAFKVQHHFRPITIMYQLTISKEMSHYLVTRRVTLLRARQYIMSQCAVINYREKNDLDPVACGYRASRRMYLAIRNTVTTEQRRKITNDPFCD
jgi:hypothetical protein